MSQVNVVAGNIIDGVYYYHEYDYYSEAASQIPQTGNVLTINLDDQTEV